MLMAVDEHSASQKFAMPDDTMQVSYASNPHLAKFLASTFNDFWQRFTKFTVYGVYANLMYMAVDEYNTA